MTPLHASCVETGPAYQQCGQMIKSTINQMTRFSIALADRFRFDFLRPPLPLRLPRPWASYSEQFQQLANEASEYANDYRSQARTFVVAMRLARRSKIASSTAGELGETERALASKDVDLLAERWTMAQLALQARRDQLSTKAVAYFTDEIRKAYHARSCAIYAVRRRGTFALNAVVTQLDPSEPHLPCQFDIESNSCGNLRELESFLWQIFEPSEDPSSKYRLSGIPIDAMDSGAPL
jgi:hypothetical protein